MPNQPIINLFQILKQKLNPDPRVKLAKLKALEQRLLQQGEHTDETVNKLQRVQDKIHQLEKKLNDENVRKTENRFKQ